MEKLLKTACEQIDLVTAEKITLLKEESAKFLKNMEDIRRDMAEKEAQAQDVLEKKRAEGKSEETLILYARKLAENNQSYNSVMVQIEKRSYKLNIEQIGKDFDGWLSLIKEKYREQLTAAGLLTQLEACLSKNSTLFWEEVRARMKLTLSK